MIEMWDGLFSRLDPRIARKITSVRPGDVAEAYDLMHHSLSQTFRECTRVLIDGGICCVNMGDATRSISGRFQLFPNHARMIRTLEDDGLVTLPYILWKKPTNRPNAFLGSGFIPTNGYVTIDCEYILIARKGGPRKFEPNDPARYRSKFTKKERDKWFSQIWADIPGAGQEINGSGERSGAFPLEIPRRLIRMFSVEEDTVLDPFMGTGTTLLAADELNRYFVGYEIDEKAISPTLLKMPRLTVMRPGRRGHF
jgi:DNA modification methylase